MTSYSYLQPLLRYHIVCTSIYHTSLPGETGKMTGAVGGHALLVSGWPERLDYHTNSGIRSSCIPLERIFIIFLKKLIALILYFIFI